MPEFDPLAPAQSAAAPDTADAALPAAWRGERTDEQTAEILRRRAVLLARPRVVQEQVEIAELISLEFGGARFAIETDLVREVVSLQGLTPLPGTPDFILGLLNVRGKIIAAVDLGRVLGAPQVRADWSQVAIVQTAEVEVAFAADSCGVSHVVQSRLRSSPPAGSNVYVKATTEAGVGVLDVERIVADTQRALSSSAAGEVP